MTLGKLKVNTIMEAFLICVDI